MKRWAWVVWYIFLVALATFGILVNSFIYLHRDVFRKANGWLTPSLIVLYIILFFFATLKLSKHLGTPPGEVKLILFSSPILRLRCSLSPVPYPLI